MGLDPFMAGPTTGRSYQLRSHLAERGHPIVGDPIYGDGGLSRLHLLPSLLCPGILYRDEMSFSFQEPDAMSIPAELIGYGVAVNNSKLFPQAAGDPAKRRHPGDFWDVHPFHLWRHVVDHLRRHGR